MIKLFMYNWMEVLYVIVHLVQCTGQVGKSKSERGVYEGGDTGLSPCPSPSG